MSIKKEHTTDLIRSKSGKILARYPHDKGPCLLDTLVEQAQEARYQDLLVKKAKEDLADARQRLNEAKEARRKARYLAIQAGYDAGVTVDYIAPRVGLSRATVSVIHSGGQ